MAECELRRTVRELGFECDEDGCIFWEHVGPENGAPRCAVQYFGLLGQPGKELAEWLLSLKERPDIERALGIERKRQLEED
ncbi:MAG: hypothetical protein ACYCXR_03070 [Coriobacteriia bacterium]